MKNKNLFNLVLLSALSISSVNYTIAKEVATKNIPNKKWQSGSTPGDVKWVHVTNEVISGTPAIGTNGTLYVTTGRSLIALDNNTGTEKWKRKIIVRDGSSNSPVLGKDGTIYVGNSGRFNKLYAFNPDGTEKWSLDIECVSTPVIGQDSAGNETIYVKTSEDDGVLWAISTNGQKKWRFKLRDVNLSQIAVDLDAVYVSLPSGQNSIYALNRKDGSLKWTFHMGASAVQSSGLALGRNNVLYFGREDRKFYAINTKDGSLKWSIDVPYKNIIMTQPVIGPKDEIYVGTTCIHETCTSGTNQKFLVINPNGTINDKLSVDTPERFRANSSAVAINNDGSITVYVGTDKISGSDDVGYLYALDPNNPSQNVRWKVNAYKPGAISNNVVGITVGSDKDNTVYYTSENGNVEAVVGNAPLAKTPWAKFNSDIGNTGFYKF